MEVYQKMKKSQLKSIGIVGFMLLALASCSKKDGALPTQPSEEQIIKTVQSDGSVLYTLGAYSLVFANKEPGFSQTTIDKMVDCFYIFVFLIQHFKNT